MKLTAGFLSLGLMFVSGVAGAQLLSPASSPLGACSEDQPDASRFEILVGHAENTINPKEVGIRHDHHASFALAIDPMTHRFSVSARIGHGGYGYDDGVQALAFIGENIDWNGTLSGQGHGRFTSPDGTTVQLAEKSDETLPGGDVMIIPFPQTSAYSALITLPGGESIKMTCQINRENLAKADKPASSHDIANTSLNPMIEGSLAPKTVTPPTKATAVGSSSSSTTGSGQVGI